MDKGRVPRPSDFLSQLNTPPPLLSQQPGDAVAEDEVLVDVSFESFDVEIVAEQSGFLAQILVGTYMTWKLVRV